MVRIFNYKILSFMIFWNLLNATFAFIFYRGQNPQKKEARAASIAFPNQM